MVWRRLDGGIEVLLGHPGGPFFVNKDDGVWSIPKGEVESDEHDIDVARREFKEETGHEVPDAPAIGLGEVRQRGGKLVAAWAVEGDLDPAAAQSNTFEMEWPPRSGRVGTFPEIDRVAWFPLPAARKKMNPAQAAFLDRLADAIGG